MQEKREMCVLLSIQENLFVVNSRKAADLVSVGHPHGSLESRRVGREDQEEMGGWLSSPRI